VSELRRLSKSGHSLVLALPRAFLQQLSLQAGETVVLELVGNTIVMSKGMSARQAELLVATSDRKRHA
jgi:antitoxin component of MazEF toxin-antitoxin module